MVCRKLCISHPGVLRRDPAFLPRVGLIWQWKAHSISRTQVAPRPHSAKNRGRNHGQRGCLPHFQCLGWGGSACGFGPDPRNGQLNELFSGQPRNSQGFGLKYVIAAAVVLLQGFIGHAVHFSHARLVLWRSLLTNPSLNLKQTQRADSRFQTHLTMAKS